MKKKEKANGFTLIELLATIAIISILFFVAIPNITGLSDDIRKDNMLKDARKFVAQARYEVNKNYSIRNSNEHIFRLDDIKTDDFSKDEITGEIKDTDGGFYNTEKSYIKYTKYPKATYCIVLFGSKRKIVDPDTMDCVNEENLHNDDYVLDLTEEDKNNPSPTSIPTNPVNTPSGGNTQNPTNTPTNTPSGGKNEGYITLSSESGSVDCNGTATFTVSSHHGGSLSCSSSDATKATCSVSGTTVTVTGVSEGSATLTVTSGATTNYNASSATYTATTGACASWHYRSDHGNASYCLSRCPSGCQNSYSAAVWSCVSSGSVAPSGPSLAVGGYCWCYYR